MANNVWQDVSGDWTAAANWSTGAAPVAADTIYILNGSQTIDTNLPAATAGVNYAGLVVGPNFGGSIATSANRLYIGSVVAPIQFDGSRCKEAWFHVDAGDSSSIEIANANSGTNACHLYGGTWAAVRARRAGQLRIGANATVTSLYLTNSPMLGPRVVLEQGATIASAYMTAGIVDCEAAIGTLVRMSGGTWNHIGDTTYDVATLDLFGGVFNFHSTAGTITTANAFGGLLDCNGGIGSARTITTLNRYSGSRTDTSGLGSFVTVTADNTYGGDRMEGF
jgi:hypothetical protein